MLLLGKKNMYSKEYAFQIMLQVQIVFKLIKLNLRIPVATTSIFEMNVPQNKGIYFLRSHWTASNKSACLKSHFDFNFNITSCLLCVFWSCECNTSFSFPFRWRYHHGFWRAFGTTTTRLNEKDGEIIRNGVCQSNWILKWKPRMCVDRTMRNH